MTYKDRQAELRLKREFRQKYGAKKNAQLVSGEKLGRVIRKPSEGYNVDAPRCQGSKRCKKRGKMAIYLAVDGRELCTKCYNRFRRDWYKAHGTNAKAVKKEKQRWDKAQKPINESKRRRRIFASWKNPELDKLRLTPEYQTWRIAVLERDGYKCQHCQKTDGRLHAHHIKTFKMNADLRYDVENGITLCKKCHEDLHIANVDKMNVIHIMRKVV